MPTQLESVANIGMRLKSYRLGKDLTPQDIAEKTGISRAAIYRYEAGYPIRVDALGQIADILEVPIASLLGVGVEYFSSALTFFERMRRLENSAEQLSVLFGPIPYLLTTDRYDQLLPDVLAESLPIDMINRNACLDEIEQLMEILKSRKKSFYERRPNIVSLVSASELENYCSTGFIGNHNPVNIDISKRIKAAKDEVSNLMALLHEQPMGIQVGVLVDSSPGSSYQILKQLSHSDVAVSPYRLGSFSNIRIGVATISSSSESVCLYNEMTRKLWERSLKGNDAISYLKKQIKF